MGFARGPTRPRVGRSIGSERLLGAGKRRASRGGADTSARAVRRFAFCAKRRRACARRASDGRRPPHRANNLFKRAKARLAKENEVYIKSPMRATKLRLAGGLGKTSGLETAACPFCYNCRAFAGEGPAGEGRFDRPGRLFACLGASRGGASFGGPNPGWASSLLRGRSEGANRLPRALGPGARLRGWAGRSAPGVFPAALRADPPTTPDSRFFPIVLMPCLCGAAEKAALWSPLEFAAPLGRGGLLGFLFFSWFFSSFRGQERDFSCHAAPKGRKITRDGPEIFRVGRFML